MKEKTDAYFDLLPYEYSMKNDYRLPSIGKDRVLVLGIGGGSDIIGAYAIASILHLENAESNLMYGLCVSPKEIYRGFEKRCGALYQRSRETSETPINNLHTSLKLLIEMGQYNDNLPEPYLLVRPKEDPNMIVKAFQDAFEQLRPDIIFAVDMGGDSLTCGMDRNELGFDRTGLRALQKIGKPSIFIVLGLGCDGESTMNEIKAAVKHEHSNGSLLGAFNLNQVVNIMSPISTVLLDVDRTPNIITKAKREIDEYPPNATKLKIVPRHRKPEIPLGWLVTGIAFDGNNFSGECRK